MPATDHTFYIIENPVRAAKIHQTPLQNVILNKQILKGQVNVRLN